MTRAPLGRELELLIGSSECCLSQREFKMMDGILGTTWRSFGREGWNTVERTSEIETSTADGVTSEQSYFVDRVIREVMQLQIWSEMRRREHQSVPVRIFDDAVTRQRMRLGKAVLRLRYAGCETLWALSPDETTMRLFFMPMTSPPGLQRGPDSTGQQASRRCETRSPQPAVRIAQRDRLGNQR